MTPPMCQETEETIAFPKSLLTRTTDCYALQTSRHRELLQRAGWRENIHDHFGVFQNDQSGPVFLQGWLFFSSIYIYISIYILNIYIYICVCIHIYICVCVCHLVALQSYLTCPCNSAHQVTLTVRMLNLAV